MSGTGVRADQVGSFLRPAELIVARKSGVDAERLTEIEDHSIERILRQQRDVVRTWRGDQAPQSSSGQSFASSSILRATFGRRSGENITKLRILALILALVLQ